MTPKEKTEEMYRTYIDYTHGHFNCKQCVRIAVDEILFIVLKYNDTQAEVTYWQEVKQEIEKL
jgi:hypothetical protein